MAVVIAAVSAVARRPESPSTTAGSAFEGAETKPNPGLRSDSIRLTPLKPDAFIAVSSPKSPLMFVVLVIVNALAALVPMTWVRKYIYPYLRSSPERLEYTKLLVDAYLIVLLAVEIVALYCWASPGSGVIAPAIAIFGLLDVFVATLRDLVISPSLHRDADGHFLLVQDPIRWFALFPLAIVQVVVCFAILYIRFADSMGSQSLEEPAGALFYSLLTFTTLGSSAANPHESTAGRVIVSGEAIFFIMVLTMKLPLAIALTRARGGGTAEVRNGRS